MIRVPGGCGSNSQASPRQSENVRLQRWPRLACCTRLPSKEGTATSPRRDAQPRGDPGHHGSRTRACAASRAATTTRFRTLVGDRLSAASSAACAPMMRLAPAPSPCWLIGNFLSAAQFSNVRQSVLICKRQPQRAHNAPGGATDGNNHVSPLWCDYPLPWVAAFVGGNSVQSLVSAMEDQPVRVSSP